MSGYDISPRAKSCVAQSWGTFEALADAVKVREKRERSPSVWQDDPDNEELRYYTEGGAYWVILLAPGIGDKTYIELACYLLLHEYCTWDEMRYGERFCYEGLRTRLKINAVLKENGWRGPFKEGRIKVPRKAVQRRAKLVQRIAALQSKAKELQEELASLDAAEAHET